MITVLAKNGFGATRQYRCPEHGWRFPSVETAIKAAKQAIKYGAVQSEVRQNVEGQTPPAGEALGVLLHTFERSESGQAIEKRR